MDSECVESAICTALPVLALYFEAAFYAIVQEIPREREDPAREAHSRKSIHYAAVRRRNVLNEFKESDKSEIKQKKKTKFKAILVQRGDSRFSRTDVTFNVLGFIFDLTAT